MVHSRQIKQQRCMRQISNVILVSLLRTLRTNFIFLWFILLCLGKKQKFKYFTRLKVYFPECNNVITNLGNSCLANLETPMIYIPFSYKRIATDGFKTEKLLLNCLFICFPITLQYFVVASEVYVSAYRSDDIYIYHDSTVFICSHC